MAADAIQGFGSIVFAQIRYLVVNLNKKNQKSSTSEIAHLLGMYGEGAFIYLIQCLVEEIDFRDAKLQKDQLKVQLLATEFGKLAGKPNFTQAVTQIFGSATLATPLTEEFLVALIKAIKAPMNQAHRRCRAVPSPATPPPCTARAAPGSLAPGIRARAAFAAHASVFYLPQALALGVGLAQGPDQVLSSEGGKFLRTKLSELTAPQGREALLPLSEDLLHGLLFFLERQEGMARPRAQVTKVLCQIYPEERAPISLVPLLYGSDLISELNTRLTFEKEHVRYVSPEQRTAPQPAEGTELADLMQDLGYSCAATAKCLGEVFSQYGELTHECVAGIVAMLARTTTSLDDSLSLHGAFSSAVSGRYLEFDAKFDADKEDAVKALTAWNLDAVVEAVNAKMPGFEWAPVFAQLDQPSADGKSADALRLVASLHKKACGRALPAAVLLGSWRNSEAQLDLLAQALDLRDEVDWTGGTRVQSDSAVEGAAARGCWHSVDVITSLLTLSCRASFPRVQALFAEPLQAASQVLLTGLLQGGAAAGSPEETPMQQELLQALFPLFLGGDSPGSAALLQRLWALQPSAIMRAMAQLHAAQPQSLLRVLDLAQSFGALAETLQLPFYSFTLDLATVAQRKDLIQLEPWLQERLRSDTAEYDFVRACLGYLREKLLGAQASSRLTSGSASSVNVLSVEAAAIFFRFLHQSNALPAALSEELSQLYAQCVQVKPKLQQHYNAMAPAAPAADAAPAPAAAAPAAAPVAAPAPAAAPTPAAPPAEVSPMMGRVEAGGNAASMPAAEAAPAGGAGGATLPGMPGGQEVQFGPEIEEEANSYFQRLYTGVTSIDEVIGMLKGFQLPSSAAREQQVYACMVHNLFDEYRYFPKYPDKPLRTTALLFGSLVQHGLVSNITLGMFLRYVLEALRKPIGSKMCTFGATALDQFKTRLPEWPQYCQHLHAIPHVGQVQPAISPFLEAVLAGRPLPATPPTTFAAPGDVPGLDLKAPGGAGPPGVSHQGSTGGAPPGMLGDHRPAAMVAAAMGGAPAPAAAPGLHGGPAHGLGGVLSQQVPLQPSQSGLSAMAAALGAHTGSNQGLNALSVAESALPGSHAPGLGPPSMIPSSASMDGHAALPAGLLGGGPPAALPLGMRGPPQSAPPNAGPPSNVAPTGFQMQQQQMPDSMASMAMGVAGFGREVDTLAASAQHDSTPPPPEPLQDKVGFVLNNMSPGNVPEKSEELRGLLEQHAGMVSWFANYLVVKRVSLEPNFHSIYSEMIDMLSNKKLQQLILHSTLQNARVLLSSPKIRSSSSERSLLKNLGSWLGQVTLARNKPILMRDLDMKELICDAYETGRLIAVVPFVAKVLDACPNSQVFMPPNPWVMGLFSLLLELYQVPDLKLNLKFEIEVLAKTLKVELADVKPLSKLATRPQDKTQTCDFANRAGMVAAGLGSGASGFGGGFGGGGPLGGGGFGGGASFGAQPGNGLGGPHMGGPGGALLPDGSPALPSDQSFGLRPGFGQQPQPPPPPPPPGPGQPPGGFGQDKGAAMLALAQQQQQAQLAQQQQQAQAAALAAQQQQAAQAAAAQTLGGAATASLGTLGNSALSGQQAAPLDPALLAGQEQTVIPNLASYVVINSGLQLFTQQPQLKRIVPIAIDRAIREIISPVVERSVTISCVTTRELMLKDFAMEPDEQRMRKAAQLMVQNLAGSLALVTCKEPLRVACGNHMRSLMQQAAIDPQLLEQVTQVCSSDNLELGCTLIEKAATEKAVRDIEEALAPAFAIRRKHREQTGLPYYDMSIFTSGRYPASLPEALRPKPGGLQPAQRRVYEDFGRIPRTAAMVQQQQAQQAAAAQAAQAAAGVVPGAVPPLPGQSPSFGATAAQPGMLSQLPGGAAGGADALGFAPTAPGTPAQRPLPGMGGEGGPSSALGQLGAPSIGGQQMSFGTANSVASSVLGGTVPGAPAAGEAGAQSLTTAQAVEKLVMVVAKLDMVVQQLNASGVASIGALPAEHDVHALLRQVSAIVSMSISRDETALAMVQKVFKRMYEARGGAASAAARLHTQVDVQLIARIHSVCNKVARFVSDMVLYSDDERKLNREVIFALLGAQMLHMAEFGAHLAKQMDGGRNGAVVSFSMALIRHCLLDERTVIASDCKELLTALAQLAQAGQGPEGLVPILEQVHATALAAAAAAGGGMPKAAAPSRAVAVEEADPLVLRMREQVAPLWEEWTAICEQPTQSDKAYAAFLQTLNTAGHLRHSEQGERFLRALCECALTASTAVASEAVAALAASHGGEKPLSFAPLDALSKLVLLMIKFVPAEGANPAEGAKPKAQVQLLQRVLAALMSLLLRDYRSGDFHQRAYFRLFSGWLFDLNAPDPTLDPIQPQVLSAFCAAFHALQPARLPGFAFSWMELVSHRMFMPKLLLTKGQKGWPLMQRLLVGLFKFLHPYLSAAELSPPVRMLYRGALRVLLVLLHDFPEFLCDYHFAFCDVIPPSCIQMRNLILSAFPRNMRLPDPFTPNLKVAAAACPPRMCMSPFSSRIPTSAREHTSCPCGACDVLTRFPLLPPAGRPPARDLAAAAHPLLLLGGALEQQHAPRRARRLPQEPPAALLPRPAAPAAARRRRQRPRAAGQRACAARGHQRHRRAAVAARLAGGGGAGALGAHGRLPAAGGRAPRGGALPLPQRHRQPAALPQQPHALLQLRPALPLLRGRH